MRLVAYNAQKSSKALHVGFSGKLRGTGSYTSYSLVGYAGNLSLDSAEAKINGLLGDTEGRYYKGNFDLNHVQRLGNAFNLNFNLHTQLASRNLDSSEQFSLGGASGVRAYPQGEAGGDKGYQASVELHYLTPIKNLTLASFIDTGEVTVRKDGNGYNNHRRLSGWGLGVIYSQPGNYYLRLDWAKKINGQPYSSEAQDSDDRLWFQVYKIF